MRSAALGLLGSLLIFTACPEPEEDPVDVGWADAGQRDARPADSGADPDAGGSDVAVGDAAILDVAVGDAGSLEPGPVTVEFGRLGAATGRVLFHDPEGVLVADVTATTGIARADLAPGGMLTFVFRRNPFNPQEVQLQTLVGVSPGEVYHYDEAPEVDTAIEFRVQTATMFPLADRYTFLGSCWSQDALFSNLPTRMRVACFGGAPQSDFLVVAKDAQETVLAYDVLSQVTPAAGSTLTFAGPWRTDLRTVSVDLLNRPTGTERAALSISVGTRDLGYEKSWDVELASAGADRRAAAVPGYGDRIGLSLSISTPGLERYRRTRGPFQAALSVDLAADFLAPLQEARIDRRTSPDRPMLSWTLPEPGLHTVLLGLFTPDRSYWQILLPASRGGLAMPELPDDLANVRPLPGTSLWGTVQDPGPDDATIKAGWQKNAAGTYTPPIDQDLVLRVTSTEFTP